MTDMNRRDWMMHVTALGVASSLSAAFCLGAGARC